MTEKRRRPAKPGGASKSKSKLAKPAKRRAKALVAKAKRVLTGKKKRSGAEPRKIRSIPSDVVLAPQAEAPRQFVSAYDQSRGKKETLRELSWMEFDREIQALARRVAQSFSVQAVVGVAHGGVFVGGAMASALGCDFFPVRISRRSRDTQASAHPKAYGKLPSELRDQRVLIVDDVAASGDTLELAMQLAKEAGASQVQTAALVQREGGYAPHHSGFLAEGLVVFPWDYEPVAEDGRFNVDPDKAGA